MLEGTANDRHTVGVDLKRTGKEITGRTFYTAMMSGIFYWYVNIKKDLNGSRTSSQISTWAVCVRDAVTVQ